MARFEYVDPPVRSGKVILSDGQAILLEALRELPDGKAIPLDPAQVGVTCASPRNALNSVGRMVRKVRERWLPDQHHRQYWHGGKIYVERTV